MLALHFYNLFLTKVNKNLWPRHDNAIYSNFKQLTV